MSCARNSGGGCVGVLCVFDLFTHHPFSLLLFLKSQKPPFTAYLAVLLCRPGGFSLLEVPSRTCTVTERVVQRVGGGQL